MLSIVLATVILIGTVMAQDALLAPKEPFIIKHSNNGPYRTTYLLEIDPSSYPKNPKHLHTRYSSHLGCPQMSLDFTLIAKTHPDHPGHEISECDFSGSTPVVCKVDISPLSPHHHLLRMTLETNDACNATLQIGVTSFGEGEESHFMTTAGKFWAMAKIAGWFFFTLILILFAIRLAVRIADSFDKPPKPPKEITRGPFRSKPKED